MGIGLDTRQRLGTMGRASWTLGKDWALWVGLDTRQRLGTMGRAGH